MICRLVPDRRPIAFILNASEFMRELVEHHREVTEHEFVLGNLLLPPPAGKCLARLRS
jgi:hypothetical protein